MNVEQIVSDIGIGFETVFQAYYSLPDALKDSSKYPPHKIEKKNTKTWIATVAVPGIHSSDIKVDLSDMVLKIKITGAAHGFFAPVADDVYMVFLVAEDFHLATSEVADGILTLTFQQIEKTKRSIKFDFKDQDENAEVTKVTLPFPVQVKTPEPVVPAPQKPVQEVFEPVTTTNVYAPETPSEVKFEAPIEPEAPKTVIEPQGTPDVDVSSTMVVMHDDTPEIPTTGVLIPDILTPIVSAEVKVAPLVDPVSPFPQVIVSVAPADEIKSDGINVTIPTPPVSSDITVTMDQSTVAVLETHGIDPATVISQAIEQTQPILPIAPDTEAAPSDHSIPASPTIPVDQSHSENDDTLPSPISEAAVNTDISLAAPSIEQLPNSEEASSVSGEISEISLKDQKPEIAEVVEPPIQEETRPLISPETIPPVLQQDTPVTANPSHDASVILPIAPDTSETTEAFPHPAPDAVDTPVLPIEVLSDNSDEQKSYPSTGLDVAIADQKSADVSSSSAETSQIISPIDIQSPTISADVSIPSDNIPPVSDTSPALQINDSKVESPTLASDTVEAPVADPIASGPETLPQTQSIPMSPEPNLENSAETEPVSTPVPDTGNISTTPVPENISSDHTIVDTPHDETSTLSPDTNTDSILHHTSISTAADAGVANPESIADIVPATAVPNSDMIENSANDTLSDPIVSLKSAEDIASSVKSTDDAGIVSDNVARPDNSQESIVSSVTPPSVSETFANYTNKTVDTIPIVVEANSSAPEVASAAPENTRTDEAPVLSEPSVVHTDDASVDRVVLPANANPAVLELNPQPSTSDTPPVDPTAPASTDQAPAQEQPLVSFELPGIANT